MLCCTPWTILLSCCSVVVQTSISVVTCSVNIVATSYEMNNNEHPDNNIVQGMKHRIVQVCFEQPRTTCCVFGRAYLQGMQAVIAPQRF